MPAGRAHEQTPGARRAGYLIAVVVNVVLWVVVNVRPGWHVLPVLTERFVDVVELVDLALLASAAVNLVYLVFDAAWFRSLSQIGVSVIGLLAAVRTLQVFPFDFSAYAFDWALVARILLYVGIVGSIIAIIVELVRLAGYANRPRSDGHG